MLEHDELSLTMLYSYFGEQFHGFVGSLRDPTSSHIALVKHRGRPVLRTGGTLLFAEHSRASEAGVARWQGRLDHVWGCVVSNRCLNRQIDPLIGGLGLDMQELHHDRASGSRTDVYLHEVQARPL